MWFNGRGTSMSQGANVEAGSCGTDACEAAGSAIYDVAFEEAKESYGSRKFWVSFFVRPCCPPPGAKIASRQLDMQRAMVNAREDFTAEQKAELISLIDEGEAWYRSTPYWHKGQ